MNEIKFRIHWEKGRRKIQRKWFVIRIEQIIARWVKCFKRTKSKSFDKKWSTQ